jgi:hypothetical protein
MGRYSPARNRMVPERAGGDLALQYAANGAIAVADGVHAITKGSAAAMTLAPPAAADEGMEITITARTAFAHTVVITEGLGGKGAAFDTMTFAAVGDTIRLLADNLHWVPVAAPYGVVIS